MKKAFHPVLFAVFPALSLFAHNFNEQTLDSLFLPLVLSVIFGLVLWMGIRFLLKSWESSALLGSIILLLIFSYGHISSFLNGTVYLLVLLEIFFFGFRIIMEKDKETVEKFTIIFNIIALSLVIMPVFLIGYKQIQRIFQDSPVADIVEFKNENIKSADLPDVYYIIVERYASEEVLKKIYNFDNSEFTNHLKSKGFYVAQSSTNYPFTITSLTSSLNMNYLYRMQERVGKDETDQYPLMQRLEDNRVVLYLKNRGYKYLHFGYEQGGLTTQNRNADFNYNSNKKAPLNISKFFSILISQTVYDPLVSLINRIAGRELLPDTVEGRRMRYYNLTLDQFNQLGNTAEITGPKFVFAHTFIAHDPHVFQPGGSYMSLEESNTLSYKQSYINQIMVTNKMLKGLIEKLQKDSEIQPVIIIQADEGPYPERIWKSDPQNFEWKNATIEELKEKSGILNAYYFPRKETDNRYLSITPVNTFRLILNLYFAENLPLLKDRVYANVDKVHLYDTFEVTDNF